MANDSKILTYAAPEAKSSTFWFVCFCLATVHFCALAPLLIWLGYVAIRIAFYEIDWGALTWPQRMTFAPWYMAVPQLLSVIAGVLTWICIWGRWQARATHPCLGIALGVQLLLALFVVFVGQYLVTLGWMPLRNMARFRVLPDQIQITLWLQGLIALPMLAFALPARTRAG